MALVQVVWQPEYSSSFVHTPNSKVTTDYLYIPHYTHTFVGEAAVCFFKSLHHFLKICTACKVQTPNNHNIIVTALFHLL